MCHVCCDCLIYVPLFLINAIEQSHKSQNAPVPYPTKLRSEQKCASKQKCAHFCSEWSIAGYGTGASWNLWFRPIDNLLKSTDGPNDIIGCYKSAILGSPGAMGAYCYMLGGHAIEIKNEIENQALAGTWLNHHRVFSDAMAWNRWFRILW